MTDVAVVIHYNRPEVAKACIESIYPQVDLVVVVDNSDLYPLEEDTEHTFPHWYTIPYSEHPGNLSKAWNIGLTCASQGEDEEGEWNVAVLNDDAIVPEGWFDAVTRNMRTQGAAAGCSGPHDVVLRQPGHVPLSMRMTGWAYVLAGEKGLRLDEQFVWWCGDTDLDWRARQEGGMAMVRYPQVANRFADQSTNGIRAVQAQEDVQRFLQKWGIGPY